MTERIQNFRVKKFSLQAGSAASGIQEGKRKRAGDLSRCPLFLYQTPLVAHPLFKSSTLTESLEQARRNYVNHLYIDLVQIAPCHAAKCFRLDPVRYS